MPNTSVKSLLKRFRVSCYELARALYQHVSRLLYLALRHNVSVQFGSEQVVAAEAAEHTVSLGSVWTLPPKLPRTQSR